MTESSGQPEETHVLAERVAELLEGTNSTVAAAESITSGSIATALAAAPNASQWFQGSVVAYAPKVKFSVLGVDPGPVITAGCARQMAIRVSTLLGADISVGTTGSGGPGDEEGQPAGTVFIAVATAQGCQVREYHFDNDPAGVVQSAAIQALRDLATVLTA
jgi:nicotinamide-nucleotide amidase